MYMNSVIIWLNVSLSHSESGSLEDLDEAGEEMDLDYCYVATQNYTKQDMDELDLYEGQVVCVIDDSDNGESECVYE